MDHGTKSITIKWQLPQEATGQLAGISNKTNNNRRSLCPISSPGPLNYYDINSTSRLPAAGIWAANVVEREQLPVPDPDPAPRTVR